MQLGYAVPAGTMSVGDLYQGTASYASPAPVQEQVNQDTTAVEEKATKTAASKTTGMVEATGLEVPALVAMFVAAIVLVRYY